MPIDTAAVQWDEMPKENSIDAGKVKWDDEGSGNRGVDMINAFGTGGNRGLLRLVGLPVDTVANVLDLGRAALGTPVTALTGNTPKWLQIPDRKTIAGSGEYLIDKARRTRPGAAVLTPVNPTYEGGYIQNAGQAVAGAMIGPQSTMQAVNQGLLGVASGTAGKFAGDRTGSPELAIAAGMLPLGAQHYGAGAVQRVVRGGEAGRRDMAQRIQDLENAGVTSPTLGLASGNRLIGGMENLLQSTPGAVKIMRGARDKVVQGMQDRTQDAADMASMNRGSLESGISIQKGLNQNFRDQTTATTTRLYDDLGEVIPADTPVNVARTKTAINTLNPVIEGAPNLSPMFQNSRMLGIGRAMDADTVGTTIQGGGGLWNAPVAVRQPVSTDKLPFQAVKKLRSAVGQEISDNTIMSDVPRSKWNPLYGALSEDMRGAAAQTGPAATAAFNRANDYNRAVIGRMDRVAPLADAKTPETAFRMYSRAAEDNLSTLRAVKKSLPEGARGDAAGTIIERLGRARAGGQDDTGSAWSPDTFLTNWNRMTPQTREELLSGFKNASEVKAAVDSVARATSLMRENSQLWANPSGTAASLAARGTLGAIGLGGAGAISGALSPLIPLAAGGGVLGANLMARAFTSPRVVRAMASKNYLDNPLLAGQVGSLISGGLLQDE
jgi:hypothetical protein